MREALISPNEATFYKECPKQEAEAVSRSIFSSLDSSDKTFSIELCPGRKVDESLLPELGLNFCSITWHSPSADQLKCVVEIPAVRLAKRLACRGYNVLLHLAGRNLHGDQVLDILNAVKDAGVRNIFALQGGSYFPIIIVIIFRILYCTEANNTYFRLYRVQLPI